MTYISDLEGVKMRKKPDVSKVVQEAEAAVQSATAELVDTRSRLEQERQLTDVLVAQWVDASEGERKSIEVRQQQNAVLTLNLGALSERLAANVTLRESELRAAKRTAKAVECMGLLSQCAEAADAIRANTRALLLSHVKYQGCKMGFEVERGHLRGLCPGADLSQGLGQDTPEQTAISKGPKLAQELRSLALYTKAADTLRHLESCGALEGDEEPLRQRLASWGLRLGIGPTGNIPPTSTRASRVR